MFVPHWAFPDDVDGVFWSIFVAEDAIGQGINVYFLAEYNWVAPRALEVDVALVKSRNCKVLELDAGVMRERPLVRLLGD